MFAVRLFANRNMSLFLSIISIRQIPLQGFCVFVVIFLVLIVASVIGQWLRYKKGLDEQVVNNLNARIYAWWVMVSVLLLAFLFGKAGVTVLFFMVSFAALWEFFILLRKDGCDRKVMAFCFCFLLPLQYYFVFVGWNNMFFVFIPVYGFLLLPFVVGLNGWVERFWETTAKIQWTVMISVFCLSHVPALMNLNIEEFSKEQNILMLVFMLVVVQASDVLQYVWGKTIGKRKIAPSLSPSKTIAGTVGGVASATLVAVLMSPITPFSLLQSALIGLGICLMGFLGGLVMSAIKRNYGVKDWGNIIKGHGGMLDRVDSICFAAPTFFYIVRYFWSG